MSTKACRKLIELEIVQNWSAAALIVGSLLTPIMAEAGTVAENKEAIVLAGAFAGGLTSCGNDEMAGKAFGTGLFLGASIGQDKATTKATMLKAAEPNMAKSFSAAQCAGMVDAINNLRKSLVN